MKRNKGFTLIELLAVIVILAIIAIIATSTILGVIETARKGAAESSALNYIDAVEKYMALSELDSTKVKLEIGQTYQVSNVTYEEVALLDYLVEKVYAEENSIILNNLITVKGDKPSSGTVKIGSNNTVEEANLVVDNYDLECTNSKCEVKGKTEVEEPEEEPEEEPKEEPDDEVVVTYPTILEKAKTLVYAADGQTCKTDGTTYNYMGGCYIKGASTNNYVWYNGFMWRIMGINSDETVRLITDENVTLLAYGPASSAKKYKENKGYIHDWLNEYFYSNLNSTKSIIQNGAYFCSEATLYKTGRTTCASGSEVTTKIGLMAIDEFLLAGASSSYLNIRQNSWTMTPFNNTDAWNANYVGNAMDYEVNIPYGVRPVINVNSSASITAGDGTAQNFFILEENKNTNVTGIISEVVTSGEYVNLEGHTYRVVRKEKNENNEVTGIKLILDGFYEETENKIYKMSYGNNFTFSLTSGIGAKLNGIAGDNEKNVITWLDLSNSDKIVQTTYYQGTAFGYGTKYQTTLNESNGKISKVGLIQFGDILASHSSTILTKKYTTTSSENNTMRYWTMNYNSTYSVWFVGADCFSNSDNVSNTNAIRPVITVRNDLQILSGNGTWKIPYEI